MSSRLPLPGARRSRAALWLLGADWLSSGGRGWQPAERRVGRGRPAEQQAHADQRGERLQDPPSPIHSHAVLQGPLLQPRILWGEPHTLKWSHPFLLSGDFQICCCCFFTFERRKVFGRLPMAGVLLECLVLCDNVLLDIVNVAILLKSEGCELRITCSLTTVCLFLLWV